jgi:ATP phosphoribosyltransferase-like protein
MQIAKAKIDELRAMLEIPRRVVILSHTNPDGDAIGSSLAWAEVLKRHGHQVTCVIPNKYPYYLEFMPGIDSVVIFKNDSDNRVEKAVKEADIIFCLDFHSMSRLDKLGEIIEVLPGMKSPTVMPLAQEGWSSVHTVLDQKCFWKIIEKLKALGAEGILVLPIEKMIL